MMLVAPPPNQEQGGRRDDEGLTQMEGQKDKCCEKSKQLCHISTLAKEEMEKEENEWMKCEFDRSEFPFSHELSKFYRNPSERREVKSFATAIFKEAREREGKALPKCNEHEGHLLPCSPPVPVACCVEFRKRISRFCWDAESGRWWKGRKFVNESGTPLEEKDATKVLVNRLTDQYWPPFGDTAVRRPIRVVALLADEGDVVRDCNAALLRRVARAAKDRTGWDMMDLKEMNNEEPYVIQWRNYRSIKNADVFITRMHQVFGYDTSAPHQKLMLAFEELRRHHGDELRLKDLIAPAAGLLMVGRLVSLSFLAQVASLVGSILNCHPAKPLCLVVPHGVVPSCSAPMPCFIPEYPLLVRLRNQASKLKFVVFDHAGLYRALKDLQREETEKLTSRRDLIFEKFYPNRVVRRVFVIGSHVFVREKQPLLKTSVEGHYCKWTLVEFAKKVGGEYVELPRDANSIGMVRFHSDPASMRQRKKEKEERKGCLNDDFRQAMPCKDDVLRLCASVISKQMNHLKIFRFDAIPNPAGKGYVLIKFVILPIMIYDGLPDAPERVLNLLVSRSTRRQFREETLRLQPLDIMEMALNNVSAWKKAGVTLGDLKTRKINLWKARFVISLDVNAGKLIQEASDTQTSFSSTSPRAVLLRFYRIVPPRRWMEDESAFANLVDDIHAFRLGPAYGNVISATYFGSPRAVAKTRDWIHGWSLKKLLLDEAVLPHKLEHVFNVVGDSLARFHLMFDDAGFHERNVEESDKSLPQSVTFYLLEIWRRDALLAASCSTTTKRLERMNSKEKMEEWDWLFNNLWKACEDIEFLKRISVRCVKSSESRRLVWAYHDMHCNNVIIEEEQRVDLGDDDDDDDDDDKDAQSKKREAGASKDDVKAFEAEKMRVRMNKLYENGPKSVQFGQADFSGPGFAVFDLASIIVSFEDIRLRQEKTGAAGFTSDVRSDAIRWIVEGYLRRLQASDSKNSQSHKSIEELAPKLIHDAWVFAPLAALMKTFDLFYDACDADDEVDEDEDGHPSVDSILQAAKNHLIIYSHTLKKLERALKTHRDYVMKQQKTTSMNLKIG